MGDRMKLSIEIAILPRFYGVAVVSYLKRLESRRIFRGRPGGRSKLSEAVVTSPHFVKP